MKALFVTFLIISLIVSIATIGRTVDKPLVLYFSFDKGDAKDPSPNKNDGTIKGAKSVSGHAGKALQFSGKNDMVSIRKLLNPSNCDFSTNLLLFFIESVLGRVDELWFTKDYLSLQL